MTTEVVKSTININKYLKEQLEYFVKIKVLDSVTAGINKAIESFVNEKQKELYAEQMALAANDAEFIRRTLCTQNDFEKSDFEINASIREEDFEW